MVAIGWAISLKPAHIKQSTMVVTCKANVKVGLLRDINHGKRAQASDVHLRPPFFIRAKDVKMLIKRCLESWGNIWTTGKHVKKTWLEHFNGYDVDGYIWLY